MGRYSVVVVGAGITGLATAHRLCADSPEIELTIFEAGTRAGGNIRTSLFADLAIDEAADAFLVRVPWALELCKELGIADALVTPKARSASIWFDGQLRPLPTPNIMGIPLDHSTIPAGILGTTAIKKLTGDGLPGSTLPEGDLSVGEVVRTCVGNETFERFVDVLLGGINAGNGDDLSCQIMAPNLLRAAHRPEGLLSTLRSEYETSDHTAPVFNTHPAGMGRLVQELVGRLGNRLHLQTEVVGLEYSKNTWQIQTSSGLKTADAVVLAVPAYTASRLLDTVDLFTAESLAQIPYASVSIASLAYRQEDLQIPKNQSGFLVPRSADLLMTACSFVGNKWDHLNTGNHHLLRVSTGRTDDLRQTCLNDTDLEIYLARDIAHTLDTKKSPTLCRISRWPCSLPQFRPGHSEMIADIDLRLSEAAPGLSLAGAFRNGVGIPACIRSAQEAAAAITKDSQ